MRVFSFTLGVLLIIGIVYCGYYTNNNLDFVNWFGVITAIISPLAFELVLFPFRARDQELIKELAKVPRIEELLKEAKDSEEKIKVLERQKNELDKLIAFESKKRTLEAEKQIFLLQGEEALRGMYRVNNDLEQLTLEKQTLPKVLQPLLNQGENNENTIVYKINGLPYRLRRKSFGLFPLYGPLLFDILKSFQKLFEGVDSITNTRKSDPQDED